jgi:cell division protein FtsZ
VLFNITGGPDLSISEIEKASQTISSVVDPEANIIFGTVTDERLSNEMRITLIGTGFPKHEFNSPTPQRKKIDTYSSRPQSKSLEIDKDDLDIPPFLRK